VSPGSHAADDGSFGRSAGIQVGRAALLIGVAVLIGVILLRRAGGSGSVAVSDRTVPSVTVTLPGGGGSSGGFTTTTSKATTSTVASPLRNPQDVKVLVANGTSTPGLAGRISDALHAKGYNTLAGTNSSEKPSATIVYFQPSYSGDATSLASKLNLPSSAVQTMAQPPPVANLNGADILVILGPDLAGSATTTTA
jgi:hypothetical protein